MDWIAKFIWGIADDILRDLYVRGKYRDVILPITVLRRLDAVLEPTKKAVLDMKTSLDKAGITKLRLSAPEFSEEGDFFVAKFYGPGDKILDLVPNIPEGRRMDLKKLGLNERQIDALRLMINEKKAMEIVGYCKRFKVNEKTARRDFKKLIETGFIEKIGASKGAFFKAK